MPPRACAEAVDRWMQQLEIECRTTVMAAVTDGDVVTAVKMLERIDKRLAPPRLSHGIEHRADIELRPFEDLSDEELLKEVRELTNRIAASSNGARIGEHRLVT